MNTDKSINKEIRIISSDNELSVYFSALKEHGINRLAIDLEGDQGSINYKYSISIIQCFDGDEAVIIDVLKTGNSPALKDLLTCKDIVKVMFSAENDLYMTQNVLDYSISPIRDIAIAQKLLGMKINLANQIGIIKEIKNEYQRANWLKRPLSSDLINYAINDVIWLLKIEEELENTLSKKGFLTKYEQNNARLSSKNFKVDQLLLYTDKFPGYRKLSAEKKEKSRILWIFREMLGEHYNCPVSYLLTKKAMAEIVNNNGDIVADVFEELNRNRKANKKIDIDLVIKNFDKATTYSRKHKL